MTVVTKKELEELREQMGLLGEKICPPEDQKMYSKMCEENKPLPINIQEKFDDLNDSTYFYEKGYTDLTPDEQQQYLFLKLLDSSHSIDKKMKTIKSCIVFFTIIAIISLVATLFVSCSIVGM